MSKVFAVAIAALAMTLATPSASHAQSTEYKYVANNFYASPFLLLDGVIADTTGEHVALIGYFRVTPSGTSFTINIDDFGTPDGLAVPVSVSSGGENIFSGCMPVRSTTTISGATAGQPATIMIVGYPERAIWEYPGSGCAVGATAGVATIDGLE